MHGQQNLCVAVSLYILSLLSSNSNTQGGSFGGLHGREGGEQGRENVAEAVGGRKEEACVVGWPLSYCPSHFMILLYSYLFIWHSTIHSAIPSIVMGYYVLVSFHVRL